MNRIYRRLCCGALILLLLLGAAGCHEGSPDMGAESTAPSDTTVEDTTSLQTEEDTLASDTEQGTEPDTEQDTESDTTTDSGSEERTDAPTAEDTTQAPDEPAKNTVVLPDEHGYTYPTMVEDLVELERTYPAHFSYKSIGQSVDGREIYACVVGNPDAPHKVLLTGGIHGKEYLSSLVAMSQVEYYLSSLKTGSYNGLSYADMLQTHAFYVLPMINPDGIMLALTGISSIQTPSVRETVEQIYADNLRDGLTSADDIDLYLAYNWKANARGVDLNRNFALSTWSEVKTGILSPCFRNYKGPSAASEPETQAVSAYVEGLGEIEALLSYHTAGQVVYWDCGMTGGVRLDTYDLAEAVCGHTGYRMIYDVHHDASLNDWITLEKGVPSVTVELANVIYPMPVSELDAAFAQTKELWVVVAQLFG